MIATSILKRKKGTIQERQMNIVNADRMRGERTPFQDPLKLKIYLSRDCNVVNIEKKEREN